MKEFKLFAVAIAMLCATNAFAHSGSVPVPSILKEAATEIQLSYSELANLYDQGEVQIIPLGDNQFELTIQAEDGPAILVVIDNF